MKNIFSFLLSVILVGAVFGQTSAVSVPEPQRVLIEVQQRAPEAAKSTVVQKANEWVDFGKNVGAAMDAGLGSLTENANKFSKTDAGKFTMAVIAWKVAGRDAMELTNRVVRVFVGIPACIAFNVLFIWFYRRNFMAYSVVDTQTGPFWNRVRTYKTVNDDKNWGEGKTAAGVLTFVAWIAMNLLLLCNVI